MLGLHAVGENILGSLQGRGGNSPDPKRGKTDSGRASSPNGVPFSGPQCEFMKKAVNSSLNTFGTALEEKFGEIDDRLHTVEQPNGGLKSTLDQAITGMERQQRELDEVRNECKRLAALLSAADDRWKAAPERDATTSNVPNDIPYELRTVGRLGRLAWGLDKATALSLAKSLLDEARVTADQYHCLEAAFRHKGSAVVILFKSAEFLTAAKCRVRHLEKVMPRADGPVWPDAQQKSRA